MRIRILVARQNIPQICTHRKLLFAYLPAQQRQSRDAANPGTTQPDTFEERVLRVSHM